MKRISAGTRREWFIALAALSLTAAQIWAQNTSTGTVMGQVTDQSGAAVGGAEVKLTDVTTNLVLRTASNDAGRYTIVNVAPGTYTLTVAKTGFSTFQAGGQNVQVGTVLTINAPLEVGSTSTTVEVSAVAGAELQVTNATVGQTITGQSLVFMPNIGRDASSFAVLQPGVTPGGAVAGAMYDQNTFQLDGGNNSNDMDGSMMDYTGSYTSNVPTAGAGSPSGTVPTPVESIEDQVSEEHFAAENLDNIFTDTHINHSVILPGSAHKNPAWAFHFDALFNENPLVGLGHAMRHHPGRSAARRRTGRAGVDRTGPGNETAEPHFCAGFSQRHARQ